MWSDIKMKANLTIAAALVITLATAEVAAQGVQAKKGDANSYNVGYEHGCHDANLRFQKYLNKHPANEHSSIFMQGYWAGWNACGHISASSSSSSSSFGGSSVSGGSSSSAGGSSRSSSSSNSSSSNGQPIIINNFR
jgi:hypothetical protein